MSESELNITKNALDEIKKESVFQDLVKRIEMIETNQIKVIADLQSAENKRMFEQNQIQREQWYKNGFAQVFDGENIHDWPDYSLRTKNKLLLAACSSTDLQKNQAEVDSHFISDKTQPFSRLMITKNVGAGQTFSLHGKVFHVHPNCEKTSLLIQDSLVLPMKLVNEQCPHFVVADPNCLNKLLLARRLFKDTSIAVCKSSESGLEKGCRRWSRHVDQDDFGEPGSSFVDGTDENGKDLQPNAILLESGYIKFLKSCAVGEEVVIYCDYSADSCWMNLVKVTLMLKCMKEIESIEDVVKETEKLTDGADYSPLREGYSFAMLTNMFERYYCEGKPWEVPPRDALSFFVWLAVSGVLAWDSYFGKGDGSELSNLEALAISKFPSGISYLAHMRFRCRFSFSNYCNHLQMPQLKDFYKFQWAAMSSRYETLRSADSQLAKRKFEGSILAEKVRLYPLSRCPKGSFEQLRNESGWADLQSERKSKGSVKG